MLFTVVIPTFNSANYIEKPLKSIEKASGTQDYEIILVDDCSSDIGALKKLVENFDQAYVFEKKQKTNAADSRNMGFLKSKGKYVFFLDSDDFFLPDAIDKRVEFHKSHNIGIAFGNFLVESYKATKKSNLPNYFNEDMREYILIKKGDFRSSVLSIDKKHFGGTVFDPKSRKHQDWIFAFRCWDNKETIGFDKEYMTVIDISGNSRMSGSLNIDASRYFYKNYLSSVKDINSFSSNNWLPGIQNTDHEACEFFASIYEPLNKMDFLKLKFYELISNKNIIPYSSRAVSKLKRIRAKYVS